MPFNDLKFSRKTSNLRTAMCGGVNYVCRKARFLSSDGGSPAPRLSSMSRSLQWRLQDQGVYLPRKPQGYRSLPARPEEQALSHGYTQCRLPQYTGQREQDARLAYLRRPCAVNDSDCPQALPQRRFRAGTGQHRLRLGCDDYRSVPLHVPLGQLQKDQGRGKAPHSAGFARQYPDLYLHLRRQAPRGQHPRPSSHRARSILHHGSGILGFRASLPFRVWWSVLPYPGQVEPEVPPAILTSCGSYHGSDLRPVGVANRTLSSKALPGETAPGEILRCGNRENSGFSNKQFCSTCSDHSRPLPLSLASRAVLQMDQAEPENQDLL